MDAINLISKIKLLDSKNFIQWYNQMIQYNINLNLEEKLFKLAINDSTDNRFYKLFKHFDNYHQDEINEYNDLISLIIPNKDYYVELAKQELIDKILSSQKIFVITLGNEDSIKLITQQVTYREHLQNSHESANKLVEFIIEHHEHKIIKVLSDCEFTEWLKSDVIVRFKKRIDSSNYYGLEIMNEGKINNNFEKYEIRVELYK